MSDESTKRKRGAYKSDGDDVKIPPSKYKSDVGDLIISANPASVAYNSDGEGVKISATAPVMNVKTYPALNIVKVQPNLPRRKDIVLGHSWRHRKGDFGNSRLAVAVRQQIELAHDDKKISELLLGDGSIQQFLKSFLTGDMEDVIFYLHLLNDDVTVLSMEENSMDYIIGLFRQVFVDLYEKMYPAISKSNSNNRKPKPGIINHAEMRVMYLARYKHGTVQNLFFRFLEEVPTRSADIFDVYVEKGDKKQDDGLEKEFRNSINLDTGVVVLRAHKTSYKYPSVSIPISHQLLAELKSYVRNRGSLELMIEQKGKTEKEIRLLKEALPRLNKDVIKNCKGIEYQLLFPLTVNLASVNDWFLSIGLQHVQPFAAFAGARRDGARRDTISSVRKTLTSMCFYEMRTKAPFPQYGNASFPNLKRMNKIQTHTTDCGNRWYDFDLYPVLVE